MFASLVFACFRIDAQRLEPVSSLLPTEGHKPGAVWVVELDTCSVVLLLPVRGSPNWRTNSHSGWKLTRWEAPTANSTWRCEVPNRTPRKTLPSTHKSKHGVRERSTCLVQHVMPGQIWWDCQLDSRMTGSTIWYRKQLKEAASVIDRDLLGVRNWIILVPVPVLYVFWYAHRNQQ